MACIHNVRLTLKKYQQNFINSDCWLAYVILEAFVLRLPAHIVKEEKIDWLSFLFNITRKITIATERGDQFYANGCFCCTLGKLSNHR